MAMEGNGPRSGNPKKLGVLLFSADPVALDSIACKIINLDPAFVPTSGAGEKAGLGTYHEENIEVVGEKIGTFIDKNFKVVRKPPVSVRGGRMRTFLKNLTIDSSVCTNCGKCVKACPVRPKAVNWHEGNESMSPAFNYDRCIRCYCCQELCPEGAVSIEAPILGRILFR